MNGRRFARRVMAALSIAFFLLLFRYEPQSRDAMSSGLYDANETARAFLRAHAGDLGLRSDISDLQLADVRVSPVGTHITFQQYVVEALLPVLHSGIRVSLDMEGHICFVSTSLQRNFSLQGTTPLYSLQAAEASAGQTLGSIITHRYEGNLVAYRDGTLGDRLVWQILADVHAKGPFEILVDAITGKVLLATSLAMHVDGYGYVFAPDPITRAEDSSCVFSPGHCNDLLGGPPGEAFPVRQWKTLKNLNPKVNNLFRVAGKYSRSVDHPKFLALICQPIPASICTLAAGTVTVDTDPPVFSYQRDHLGFEEVNAYYHIDTFASYLNDSLGFSSLNNFQVNFDVHNALGRCAQYDRQGNTIYLGDAADHGPDEGETPCVVYADYVDAGEDQDIIIHEYGHALDQRLGGDIWFESTSSDDMKRMAEGYSDYCAVSYRRYTEYKEGLCGLFQPKSNSPWFARTYDTNDPRVLQDGYTYPPPELISHYTRLLWASTLMEVEEAIGHKEGLTVALGAMSLLFNNSTMIEACNAIVQADINKYSGEHVGQLVRIFARRGFYATRSGTLSGNEIWTQNTFLSGDLVIPTNTSLTISPIPQLKIFHLVVAAAADYDAQNLGSDPSRVEVITNGGTLTINGLANKRIRLVSGGHAPDLPPSGQCFHIPNPPEEGDWGGIDARNAAGLSVNYGLVTDAVYGVMMRETSGGTNSVTNSIFTRNSNADILIGTGGNSPFPTVTGNSITIASGKGIEIVGGNFTGATISNNVIIGNSLSTHGILCYFQTGGSSPVFSGNTVGGLSNGNGITISSGNPILTGNLLEGNKYGIQVTAGSPQIGTTSSSSDNFMTGNTYGAYFKATPGTCPPFGPVKVRNNVFDFNGSTGAFIENTVNVDLGTTTENGNNWFNYNTVACIWNSSSCGQVSARGNYFNEGEFCSPPPSCTCSSPLCTLGSVDVGGQLCVPPATVNWPVEPTPPREILAVGGIRPNPSSHGTTIDVQVGERLESIDVEVFDITGRLVRSMEGVRVRSGTQDIFWDSRDNSGAAVPGGLYLIRVEARGLQRTAKVLVAR